MALWTPAEITTALWHDAGDPTARTMSTGVSSWWDKSGNNRHSVQASGSSQPAVIAAAQNGLDVLDFDGVNDYLISPNVFTAASDVSVFIVCATDVIPSSPRGVMSLANGLNSTNGFFHASIRPVTNNFLSFFSTDSGGGGTTGLTPSSLVSAGSYFVSVHQRTAALAGLGTNGAYAAGAASGQCAFANAKAVIGGYYSLAELFNGKLCEIAILPYYANTALRQKIEGYLHWKWGLQALLATDHPYRYAAPSISESIRVLAALQQTWGDVAVVASELHQPWGIKTGADLIQPWSNAPQVRGALYQPWGEALAARADLVQPWGDASSARAMLVQPWASSSPQRAELVQPWGDASAARGILEQPWGEASAARAELVQPWSSSFPQRAELVQPWASSFPQRAELVQGWNVFGVIVAELEQRWAITEGLVRGELLQGWDLRERDLLRAELVQRWAIEADGTDVAGAGSDGVMRYVVAVRVGGAAVGIDQLNIEGGTDGDTITCEIQIGSEDDYLRCAIGAALEVTITSVDGTDDFVFVITDARIAEEHGKTTYAVEAESPGVLLGDSYADPVDGELAGMASAIAASLAGGV